MTPKAIEAVVPIKPKHKRGQLVNRKIRFSKERIAALAIPAEGQQPAVWYDSDLKGLGLRIQPRPSGKAVYFVLKKVQGRAFRKTLGDADHVSVEQARKLALGLLSDIADWNAGDKQDLNPMQTPLDDGKFTFALAFESYLRSPRKRVTRIADANLRARYTLKRWLGDVQGRLVTEFTPTMVGLLHEQLTKKYGPRAANRAHEMVRVVFNNLIKTQRWATTNPAIGANRNPKVERSRILRPDEIGPFLDALEREKNQDFADFVKLLFWTGARKGNLYSSEWKELNLAGRKWTIPAEKYKNGKETTLVLKREAVELFEERKAKRQDDCPWVFPSRTAKCGHIVDYKRQFDRLRKAAGLQDFTFHDIRRSFVAAMVSSGKASMPVISAAAGHSSLDSMKPYARFATDAVDRALQAGSEEIERQRKAAAAEAKKRKSLRG